MGYDLKVDPHKYQMSWEEVESRAFKVASTVRSDGFPGGAVKIYGVPRGGIPAALLVQQALQYDTVMVEDPRKADLIVDDIIDSGETKKAHEILCPSAPFVSLVDKTNGDKEIGWVVFPWERMSETEPNGVEDNVVRLLQFIGEDPTREGLLETPSRVLRSYVEMFAGYREEPAAVLKTFEEGSCDEMVLLTNFEFYSMCEHHMLPFFGKAHIAYIPDGKVVGISKLVRLLDVYARRLQIQEKLTEQVTKALMEHLQPKGAACVLEAQHFCMMCRGVNKQNSVMKTSSLLGVFRQPEVRQEFFNLIRG